MVVGKGARSFDEMTNLSKSTRELLKSEWTFKTLTEHHRQIASDGTTKFAWRLCDGSIIESVLIPGKDKYTVCVSSQVGCKLGCKFCATGSLYGYKRDLTVGEIFDQVSIARQILDQQGFILSNIVFMGMGEPLLNYNNVMKAIDHITSDTGLAMSPYRITVSTAGIPNKIIQLANDNVRFNLAVSLHSANNTTRSELMPINNVYDIDKIAEALKYFVEKTGTRPTFEYLLLSGINDSLDNAKELARYCRQFPIKINVIEYNNVDSSGFKGSSEKRTKDFLAYLEKCNMVVNVRRSKGKDIDAACGQLANKRSDTII